MINPLARDDPGPTFWVSLRYFSITRMAIAAALLGAVLTTDMQHNFGVAESALFLRTAIVYAVLGAMFVYFASNRQTRFYTQLAAQLLVDLVVLTAIMHVTGGPRGGFVAMFLLPIAGAAILSPTMLALGFAAICSLAILFETFFREIDLDFNSGSLLSAGLYGTGSFAIALVMNRLAARLIAQEAIAAQRGEALRSQIEINRLVVADMKDGVLILSTTGEPRSLNGAAVRMLRVEDAERLIAGGWDVHPAARDIQRAFLQWNRGKERGDDIVDLVLPDDGQVPVRIRARFLVGGHAQHGGDHVVLLEDLNRLEERAQQLKLASMGRLTASIAHEIRNPLAAISHARDLLAESDQTGPEARLLEIVRVNALRLDRIVQNILQISRKAPVAAEQIDLQSFVASLVDEFCRDHAADQSLFDVSIFGAPILLFNSEHLRQVVLNLWLNARRYASGEPGSIRFTVVPVAFDPKYGQERISGALEALERIELIVQDDGPGVDQEAQLHLFEPFFTTHAQGTGLGLFLAREICMANGATLSFVTNVDDSKWGGFVVNAGGTFHPEVPLTPLMESHDAVII